MSFLAPFDERSGGGRDHALDGVRAVAVSCVILGHTVLFRLPSLTPPIPGFATRAAGSLASTGVEVFFLISGYVITRLLIVERLENGSNDVVAFYIRRVLRIIPAFYVYLLIITLLSASGYIISSGRDTITAAVFICNTGIHCNWFVGHSWSLAVEEQFYLIWPSLFLLFFGNRFVLFVSAIIFVLALISLVRGFVPFSNNMSFLYIAIGALVASSIKLQAFLVNEVDASRWCTAALFLLLGILFLPDRTMLIGKPLLLCTLVFSAANVSVIRSALKTNVVQYIGMMSYSLYLWQQLFLSSSVSFRGAAPNLLLFPACAWLSWRLVEIPGIRAGRAFSSNRRVKDCATKI